MHPNSPSTEDRLQGLLLGAAMGDALGLPSEGLTRGRIARLWPGPLRHRFIAGRGMGSDDTEHLVFTTLSLLRARSDVELFQATLAGHLKRWLLLFPAGVGLATARSILKLWLGWKPGNNGVFSAGNGPGMRSSIIGAFFARDPALMQQFVATSTRLTHTDPKALTGAHSLAQAAAWILSGNEHAADLFKSWSSLSSDAEWLHAVKLMQSSLIANRSVSDLAIELGFRIYLSQRASRPLRLASPPGRLHSHPHRSRPLWRRHGHDRGDGRCPRRTRCWNRRYSFRVDPGLV
jgi:ADP-ribosyl-[dinitrogen reductase] hydrolase